LKISVLKATLLKGVSEIIPLTFYKFLGAVIKFGTEIVKKLFACKLRKLQRGETHA